MDPRFVIEPFEPAYLGLDRTGEIGRRADKARKELEDCRACPRDCRINRLRGETRVCHTGRHTRVASAAPHFGEENCLRGTRGSGTIFFSSCNLRCTFCQNWDISQGTAGSEHTPAMLADLMLELQNLGCHNINFVTPEHVAPQVVEAITEAIPLGLTLPIVYNTSAYDSLGSLELLDGLIDIYMPDIKFWTKESSLRFLKAKDYPQRALEAVLEMHRQVGPLRFAPDGTARRGVLVRHLVMPGFLNETDEIFRWLAKEVSEDTFVNIMAQYRPEYKVGTIAPHGEVRYEEINKAPSREELTKAYELARAAGLWRFDERLRF